MPKTVYQKKKEVFNQVIKNTEHRCIDMGIKNNGLTVSKLAGIPQTSYYNRKKNPEKFNLEELQKIADGLNIRLSDLLIGII